MRCRRAGLIAAALAAVICAASANAAQVTWSLSGRVTLLSVEAQAALGSLGVAVGTPFTAQIVYDSSVPGINVSPPCCEFLFPSPVISLQFEMGDYSFVLPPGPATGEARYSGSFFSIGVGRAAPTLDSPSAGIALVDTLGPSLSLPVAPPGLFATFSVYAGEGISVEGGALIFYSVPEPSALALFLLAALALISLRRAGGPRSSRE